MMRFLMLSILVLAPSPLFADQVSTPKSPAPLSGKSLKTLMQLAPLNGLLAKISQNAANIPTGGTSPALSDYDEANSDLLLENCRNRISKDLNNIKSFSGDGKFLDVSCLSSSKLPEDIALAARALEQDNDYGRSIAINTLLAMGAREDALNGLRRLALDVRSKFIGYQVGAASQLVELGELEWLGILTDYAAMKLQHSEAAMTDLNRFTGLQFSEASGWQDWWRGIREGRSSSDKISLSPEWTALRSKLLSQPWYIELNKSAAFEKKFFSKDSGAPGQGVFDDSINTLRDNELKTACLRWYALEFVPVHKDKFQSAQLRALMRLWDSGMPICLGELPKTLDLPDMVLQLDSKGSRKQLRDIAKSGDEVWRAWAVRYLMVIGDKETADLASDLTDFENPFVLWSAADALCHDGAEKKARTVLQKLVDKRAQHYSSYAAERLSAVNSGSFKPFNVNRCR